MTYEEQGQDDLLSVPDVAGMLRVSPKTINRLIGYGRGELPAVMVGSRWKVRTRDLKEYLQKRGGAFSDDQALEMIAPEKLQDNRYKNDILQLDLQKKHLELIASVLEVVTRMINCFYPDIDVQTKATLIRTTTLDFLGAGSIQELEQAILKNSPISQ